MENTEISAKAEQIAQTVIFNGEEHRSFFLASLPRCRYADAYHAALVYCLGIDQDTRKYIDSIYDFKTGCVKPECLREGWITSGSSKIIRMAYNLYCNGTPSVNDDDDTEQRLQECRLYTVEDLFCCGYAKYFWQAIKVRYPEYCYS